LLPRCFQNILIQKCFNICSPNEKLKNTETFLQCNAVTDEADMDLNKSWMY